MNTLIGGESQPPSAISGHTETRTSLQGLADQSTVVITYRVSGVQLYKVTRVPEQQSRFYYLYYY